MRYRVQAGFTLIELLVVLAILGMLLSIVAPNYISHVDAARETALKQDLVAVRDSIDKFYTDHARYPQNLQELITTRYLRFYPTDPVTGRADTWVFVAPADGSSGVIDIKSGATGTAANGSRYADW